ncbi:MAG: hypothetical protein AB7U29_19055 [Desulfobulbus sp.]
MQHIHEEPQGENAHLPFQVEIGSAITPIPWTVESHPDTEGAYIIQEARQEQRLWCDQGYDISEDEGNRRSLIVACHNVGNMRLLQAAPWLFVALRDMVTSPSKGKEAAVRALEKVSPYWQEFQITSLQSEEVDRQ